jgi:beta-glucosidase
MRVANDEGEGTMGTHGRRAAIALAVVALSGGVAAGVVAATQSSDEAALAPSRQAASQNVEKRVNALLAKMTLKEKLQQIQLLSDGQINDAEAMKPVGGVFSLVDPAKINHFQHVAVEKSRLHIPILFAYDTIHGYRTIFPIPLGAASSFDPSVASDDHFFGARESAAVGIKQIYSPMVDVSHEPRWGRISEAGGEDPYLNSVFAAARVKAAQGGDYSKPDKVVTSVKHYAAYGQPEGGRDYNTTDMSEQRLRNLYLPPFKAAIDAGADTAMCSFNAISGVPGCANSHLETDVLKKEWGFDGFIESDYTAVSELRACPPKMPDTGPCGHGVAKDGPGAAAAALNAGTDSEMVSTNIQDFGESLRSQGKISQARIDDAVRRILRVKFRAGLFEHPYVDPAKADAAQLRPDAVAAARKAAGRSMVLLKNDGATLPLNKSKKTAVIGPLGNSGHDMLGPWWGQGKDADAVTVFDGIKKQDSQTTFTQGCTLGHKEPPDNQPADECDADANFGPAVAAATAADQVVLAVGESREMSGEAASRSEIDLPGKQEELIQRIKATGKPLVVVLFNGRPLTLEGVVDNSPALLEAWFPGVQAGNAVADVVFGGVNPGGKLPVSFPRRVGQVPIYYNHEPTGRPCDATAKYDSRYRDIPSCEPQFPFGFGLSYSKFTVSNLRLSSSHVSPNGKLTASVDVTNDSGPKGDDVVQLYIHDPVASITQPVRRLRGFERVTLDPGKKKTVTFTLDKSDFGFYDNAGKFVVEPGTIDVFAGDSSKADLTKSFEVG